MHKIRVIKTALLSMLILVSIGFAWTEIEPRATDKTLNAIHFSTAANGWAVGDRGTVLRTRDGGGNWSALSIPPNCDTINFQSVFLRIRLMVGLEGVTEIFFIPRMAV
jgi:photosystem II stability/assembly factor-like uncharacterized protein